MRQSVVNALRTALDTGEFLVTLEYCLPQRGEPLKSLDALTQYARATPAVHAVALTDRVTSEDDYDPLGVAEDVMRQSGKVPLIHLSGKDRTAVDLQDRLRKCACAGLDNVLLITGDMPRPETAGCVLEPAKGFLDSVHAVHAAAELNEDLLISSAISTFKYSEPELMNQYIKMHKKVAHGARLIFNQVGYDLRKTQELTWYLRHAGEDVPVVAALYWLAPGFARFAQAGHVPGVTFTDDFCRRLEEIVKEPDKGIGRRIDMMALHTALCKRFGYRGAHIGGLRNVDWIDRILTRAFELDASDATTVALWDAWCAHLRLENGTIAELGRPEGFYLFESDPVGLNTDRPVEVNGQDAVSAQHRVLRIMHDLFFAKGLRPGGLGERVVRGLAHVPLFKPLGYVLERAVKTPLLGCEGCGSCSLPDTEYVCIEGNCAKHLLNGPCGGQRDGTCEAYPERPCAWVEIYNRAKNAGNLAMLRNRYVNPKDRALRHTCSWINLCLDLDHHGEERATEREGTNSRR
jgi:methylenetetrahydrofolate reductase (NADPH)